ncbi:hypothetical protein N1028_07630 [Herbiconiux sp. CPCC 203407]|uniref:Uncharacterized protein n=1 Tax=Herbiconiux oxytropis TaxID=2970915 RepID=A0AA42BU19_9MICO|nr:hypothetical protein [Herbiconiux oxytropis]MCS5722184.1 hypothetical protein [Herbiconiux oxytropis]MCS5725766.1 hypothetical protein [Herbiconiux oxytropis]
MHRDGGREDRPGRVGSRSVRGLRIVLCLDLAGVVAAGTAAAVIRSRAVPGSSTALDGALVGACAAVAGGTWLLAVVAVARVADGRIRRTRGPVMAGLVLNAVGNLTIAVSAGRPAAAVAGLALAVGGTAASVSYLRLMPGTPSPRPRTSA